MSDEKIAQSVMDGDVNRSPKSLDERVLAYAKRKAQSNRNAERIISLPPIFSGVAGLAVLAVAVLLFPQLQQRELASDNNPSVAVAPEAEIQSNINSSQAKPQSAVRQVSNSTVRAKRKASFEIMQSDSLRSEHEASDSEGPIISAAPIMAKPLESDEAGQALQSLTQAKSIAKPEYNLEEIVVNDDTSSVTVELVRKNLKTLVELKKLFQHDEIKAEVQYQLFRKTEQELPESFPALFDLIDEMVNNEKAKNG